MKIPWGYNVKTAIKVYKIHWKKKSRQNYINIALINNKQQNKLITWYEKFKGDFIADVKKKKSKTWESFGVAHDDDIIYLF